MGTIAKNCVFSEDFAVLSLRMHRYRWVVNEVSLILEAAVSSHAFVFCTVDC